MKSQVELVVGNFAISAFGAKSVGIVGAPGKLKYLAYGICPFFHATYVHGDIEHMWCYRGVFLFKDCSSCNPYCVVYYHGSVSRFSSLQAAKSAITRFINKRGVRNDL